MTAFLIIAALLALLAMAFVLVPLLRQGAAADIAPRDQLNLQVLRHQLQELEADLARGAIDSAAYGDARKDLERRVAEEVRPAAETVSGPATKRWQAVLLALLVPALAAGLYYKLGAPSGLNPELAKPEQSQSHELTAEQITGMVESLAQRLKSNPDDAEGWNMLARSYNALGRYAESAEAYAQLARLIPDDASLLADYADTLAMSRGRSLQGEPEQLVARALKADPQNVKALALAGSAAFERKAYAEAIAQWKKVLQLVPPESDMGRSTANGIAEAEQLGGIAPSQAAQPQPAAANATVSGSVELDPNLRGKVSDTDTVFIYARAAEGPRFPLAVVRKQVKDLPVRFELDDSMSMVPEAKLSGFPLVVVGARISKGGSATPAPGDLEGTIAAPVRPGTGDLRIVVDQQRK